MKLRDLAGQKFGRLTAVRRVENNRRGHARWLCVCDCDGKELAVNSANLVNGHTRSCGCLRAESMAKLFTTHGHTKGGAGSSEYTSWRRMLDRCYNLNNPGWARYGGRGITACERWSSFTNFLSDMGFKPAPEYEIDRWPDNDGNYEPGNCRWATIEQQANNKGNNRPVTAFGQTKNLTTLARLFSIHVETLRKRLDRDGLSAEHALLDQGELKNRINVPSGASFEERCELIRRMNEYQAMTPAERRDARRARFKAIWDAADRLPVRRSGLTPRKGV